MKTQDGADFQIYDSANLRHEKVPFSYQMAVSAGRGADQDSKQIGLCHAGDRTPIPMSFNP
jgi:hypothetical protein